MTESVSGGYEPAKLTPSEVALLKRALIAEKALELAILHPIHEIDNEEDPVREWREYFLAKAKEALA